MARLLPLLTLIPSIFTLISIILICIGGVNQLDLSRWKTDNNEKNTQFDLISWNFDITPAQQVSIPSYHYTLYLNRFCAGSSNGSNRVCRNIRQEGRFTDSTGSPNALMRLLKPFNFDDLDMRVTFVFYIFAAISATWLIFTVGVAVMNQKRCVRTHAVFVSTIGTISMVVASSVITYQIVHLRNQLWNDTTARRALLSGTSPSTYITYNIEITRVALGQTLLGLSWTSTVLMMSNTVLWVCSMLQTWDNHSLSKTKGVDSERSQV